LIAVLGPLGGAFITSWVQRDSKKITLLQTKVDRYRAETQAGIGHPQEAALSGICRKPLIKINIFTYHSNLMNIKE